MVPTVELPPVVPLTCHVTAVFEVFATTAVNCCVCVTLTVGVLNTGDLGGTVFADALLKFDNRAMHVSADQYKEVTGHSFSEVLFNTAREDNGKYWGTFTVGEEPIIKAWSDLVKGGKEIPFELTITLNGRTDTIKGTVSREE